MSITAKLKHLHIAPRKTRLVADLIRGKSVNQALTLLDFTPKKAAKPLYKLLRSAIANAISNDEKNKVDKDNLYISKITVDQGPTNKRWRARSRGQTFGIQKKTSHINIILDESKEISKKSDKTPASAKATAGKGKTEEVEKVEKSVKTTIDKEKKALSSVAPAGAKEETKKPAFAKASAGKEKIEKPTYKEEKKKFQPKIGKLSEKIFRRKSF